MAEKIMLFLSPLKDEKEKLEASYQLPDGSGREVYGYHTNEAPVKALLTLHPEVTDIICICSKEVTEKPCSETAYSYFVRKTNEFCANNGNQVRILQIPFETNQSVERELLPSVLDKGKLEPGDILYLDATGGPRDNVMRTVLLSRALMYMGVETRGMVYSNFTSSPKQVIDITETLRMFDLLEGIQNYTSFGAVRQLRDFYGRRPPDDDVEKLLVSMENLMDDITLCRFNKLGDDLPTFNQIMRTGKFADEPLLEKLLPRFRETYCKGQDNEMSELELIAWCMDSDRLQTALTLYTETLPQLLIKQQLVIISRRDSKKEDTINNELEKGEQNEDKLLFNEYILYMNLDWKAMGWKNNDAPHQLHVIQNLGVLLKSNKNKDADGNPFVKLNCKEKNFKAVLRDFVYLREIRNMLCHARTTLPSKKAGLIKHFKGFFYTKDKPYPSLAKGTLGLNSEQVKDVLRCAIERVEAMIQ